MTAQCFLPITPGERPLYKTLRDGIKPEQVKRRNRVCQLLAKHKNALPKDFEKRLQPETPQLLFELVQYDELNARFPSQVGWAKKDEAGPDFCIAQRVYVEATAPKAGTSNDAVRGPEWGMPRSGSDEVLFRLTSALNEKRKKFDCYINSGVVKKGAACIIAIAGNDLECNFVMPEDWHVVLHGEDKPFVDLRNGNVVGYTTREEAKKKNNSPVELALFDRPQYGIVAGVLVTFGGPDILTNIQSLVFCRNPNAQIEAPDWFIRRFNTR